MLFRSVKNAQKKPSKATLRLFQPATVLGYARSRKNTHCYTSLLQIKDVHSRKDTTFYLGKRCCYVYVNSGSSDVDMRRLLKKNRSARTKVIWGRITRPHGNIGTVRAKFAANLPTAAIGKKARIYLFPSSI